jgi:hypothetical protein
MQLLLRLREEPSHGGRDALPVLCFFGDLFASDAAERIKLGAAIGFRNSPLGVDPAALPQAQQSGVDGALVEGDGVTAHLLDARVPCRTSDLSSPIGDSC